MLAHGITFGSLKWKRLKCGRCDSVTYHEEVSVVLGVAPDLLNLVDNKVVSVLPVRLHTPHDLDPLTLREIRSFLPV